MMMKHAVTGQLERYTTYTSNTHTQTILLLDLQYLQQLPFLIYQWRRYANLSGPGLVEGMSTQSAVSFSCICQMLVNNIFFKGYLKSCF